MWFNDVNPTVSYHGYEKKKNLNKHLFNILTISNTTFKYLYCCNVAALTCLAYCIQKLVLTVSYVYSGKYITEYPNIENIQHVVTYTWVDNKL